MATLFGSTAEPNKRQSGTLFGSSPSGYDTNKVNKQIENAETRIRDAGYVKADSDQRNIVEKALNLPEGQNAFFDVLEVLGRPGSAVMNAIDKGMEGENVATAAWRGLSGKDRITGSDLAEKMGVENKAGKFLLGTALDIGLDPTTYIPGGVIAKGVKKGAALAAKPVKAAYNAAENALPTLKTLRTDTIQPLFGDIKDAFGYALGRDYKLNETLFGGTDDTIKNLKQQTENNIDFMTEESMRNISDTAKLAGGIDTGTDVGRILEKDLKQFEDVKGYEFPDGVRRTTDKNELLSAMDANRESIKNIGKELNQTKREYAKSISETASQLEKMNNQITRYYFSRENAALRKLNSKKNKPLNIDELAQKSAFGEVSVSPKFNLMLQRREELKKQLDELKIQANAAKSSNIDRIRVLTDENGKLKESMRNPVMIQQVLSRPVREYSESPQVQQAARNLMESNTEIREWANANGVGIPELEGYMTHILAAEERKRRRNMVNVDKGNRGTGQPNKSVTNPRKLTGSAEDINERMVESGYLKDGETFFEPNAYFATAIGQKRLIEYVNAVNFRRQVLTNENFARKVKDGERVGDLPKNQVVIDSNNYKFLKESGDVLDGAEIGDEIGGQYVVTKAVKNALDRYQKLTTDEGIDGFLNAYDKLQSTWKRATLFSIPYHIRNDIGAKFNNWVGGMNTASLLKYSAIADKEVFDAVINGVESEAYKEFRKQGLGNSSLAQIEFAKRGEEPEEAIRRTIENRSKTTGQKVAQRLNPLNAFQTSQEFGSFIDSTNRFALFKWALDKGMTPEQAAKKVREVQFDYSNMTALEREVLSRVVPFYRWMRNNLPFQIKQFIQDPRKYANINKVRENAQEAVGIDDENVPDWMKSSFAIPVNGEDGSGQFLGLNLPLGDLTKISDPLKLLLDSVTPLAKLPAEVALNRNFFYDKPIEKFEGQQKQFQIPGTNIDFGIDATTAYVLEQLTGQMGRGLSGYLQKPEDADQDRAFRMPSMGISSILKPFDAEKAQYFQQQEELRKLLDLIQYIEQQTGQDVRTVNEIQKAAR